jgi:hypothetical protein
MERIRLIRVTDTSLGRLQPGACPKLPQREADFLLGGSNPYAVKWTPPAPAKPKATKASTKAEGGAPAPDTAPKADKPPKKPPKKPAKDEK